MSAPERYKHFMVDLETMGPAPNGAIIAVGIVPFSLHPQRLEIAPRSLWYNMTCSLPANQRAGRLIDGDTVEWWLQQSPEAQAGLWAGEARFTDFRDFIGDMVGWWCGHADEFVPRDDRKVWAKPPEFDLALLEHALESTGHAPMWTRRASRDLRTVLDRAKFDSRDDVLGLERAGEHHVAVEDAAHQARQVILSYCPRGTEIVEKSDVDSSHGAEEVT